MNIAHIQLKMRRMVPVGHRQGTRLESRQGPRLESRQGPRLESRQGPRLESRQGPRLESRQGGSTMIEVMVAVLVLALGMMGMLGMFISSIKITSGAIYRNVAAQQAYAIADSMRANLPNLSAYFSPSATATSGCLTTSGCTAAQLPNTEYKMWQTQLGTLLPAGQGVVCRDSAASGTARTPSPQTYAAYFTCDNSGPVVVKVCWDETRIQNSNASAANVAGSGGNASTGGVSCLFTNI